MKLLKERDEQNLYSDFAIKQELKKSRAKANRKNKKLKITASESTKTQLTLEKAKRLLPSHKQVLMY